MVFKENRSTKSVKLAKLAHDLAKNERISFALALGKIARLQPKLAEEAREEALKRNIQREVVGEPGHQVVIHNFLDLVQTRSISLGIPFAQALSEICRDDPESAARYRDAVLSAR
jgi:hypothetical protein